MVSCDTGEMSTEYARTNTASNSSIWTDEAVSSPAITQMPCRELSGGAVNARSRVAVGAERRGIDGAEYSSILDRVMAGS